MSNAAWSAASAGGGAARGWRKSGGHFPGTAVTTGCGLMLALLAGGLWIAFAYRDLALASVFDPDCPSGGCYAPVAVWAVPMVAGIALAVGVLHTVIGLRQRFTHLVPWLFVIVVWQWMVVGGIMAASLLD